MWRLNILKSGSSLPGLTRSGLPTTRLKLSTSAKSQAEFEQLQSDESFIIHDWLERFGPEVNKSLRTLHPDRPVVEIISFDDFGGLFLRNVHPSTFSSPEEIVEAFQRVESISPPEFRDSLVVPDRIGTSELGNGSDEVGIEAEQLGEEADIPDIALQFMQESDDSDLVLASLCSSQPGPSTSAVSSSSTAPSKPHPPSTRRILSDKIRSVRRHHLSTKTANNSENLPALPQSIPINLQLGRISKSFNIPPSILETDPPIFVPRDPKLVVLPVKTEAIRIKEKKKELASIEDLKLLVSQGNITEFSLILAEKRVLKSANLKFSFSVFGQFIVEKAEKAEEAMGALKNLLILDSTATLPASIVWVLIRRLCEENGPVGLKEQINAIYAEFMTRTHFSKKIKNEVFDEQRLLYSTAWTKDSNSALDLFEAMTQLGFDRNAESFLHEGVTVMYKEKSSFSEILSRWQPLSSRYSTTAGSSVVWQALLKEEESQTNKQFGKSISQILWQCQQFDHPFACLAELLCALLQSNRVEDAKQMMTKLAVSGRYFVHPLEHMAKLNDLENMEKVAELVSYGIYGHRKRAVKAKEKAGEVIEEQSPEESKSRSKLLQGLAEFYGWDRKRKKFVDYSKGKKDKKLHKVDEKQLHFVALRIQELWQKVAERNGDKESLKRLRKWEENNKLEKYQPK